MNQNFTYAFAELSHIGKRNENQDYMGHFFYKNTALLVVADGLGGHKGGALAAQLFTDHLIALTTQHIHANHFPNKQDFQTITAAAAIKMSRDAIAQNSNLDPRTTFVLAWLTPNGVLSAHIGDSRFYLLRDNRITQSQDHSLVQILVNQGRIRPEEAATHPDQNKLYHSVGGPNTPPPTFSSYNALQAQESVLLCTDGFWEHVSKDEIIQLSTAADLSTELHRMVQLAVRRGGKFCDNVTAQILRKQ